MYTDRMGLKGKSIWVWSSAKDYTANLIWSDDSSLIVLGYFLRLHMEVIEWTPYILDSLFLVEQAHPWQLSYTDELESYYQEKSNIEKWDLASWFLLISYIGAKWAWLSNTSSKIDDILNNPEVQNTLKRIEKWEPKYKRDWIIFENREWFLPKKENTRYYKEWTVDTPWINNRWEQRIVIWDNGELYYSINHYRTKEGFTQI